MWSRWNPDGDESTGDGSAADGTTYNFFPDNECYPILVLQNTFKKNKPVSPFKLQSLSDFQIALLTTVSCKRTLTVLIKKPCETEKRWCVCMCVCVCLCVCLRVPPGSPSRGGDVTVYVCDTNQPSSPTPFYSVLVSISVFMALSNVFHSINSPDNSPFSHPVLPVLSLPYRFFQLYVSLWKFPSALI